jgi:hypothetical protein
VNRHAASWNHQRQSCLHKVVSFLSSCGDCVMPNFPTVAELC